MQWENRGQDIFFQASAPVSCSKTSSLSLVIDFALSDLKLPEDWEDSEKVLSSDSLAPEEAPCLNLFLDFDSLAGSRFRFFWFFFDLEDNNNRLTALSESFCEDGPPFSSPFNFPRKYFRFFFKLVQSSRISEYST